MFARVTFVTHLGVVGDVAADAGARRQRQAAMAPLRGQVECGFEQAQFTWLEF